MKYDFNTILFQITPEGLDGIMLIILIVACICSGVYIKILDRK